VPPGGFLDAATADEPAERKAAPPKQPEPKSDRGGRKK
jgi:hypothetical protein